MNKKLKILISLILVVLAVSLFFNLNTDRDDQRPVSIAEPNQVIEDSNETIVTQNPEKTDEQMIESKDPEIARRVFLSVPFIVQAPTGDWSEFYENACEEAALLMTYYYKTGKKITNQQEMIEDLNNMVIFGEMEGYYTSITLAQLNNIAKDYLKLNNGRIQSATQEAIEREIIAGRPVIIPADGKKLKNPYFRGDGPYYHMLVITGYDETDFITNDPGTKRGQNYRYEKNHLINAIFDYDKDDMSKGQKSYLVFD